ncbi:MAG TPA: HNH endonuclease [Candidatus Deferrimicrobium sp.]|nr:HNH endonuclease [Candidatus Deferrimicrobium sp.]
MSATRLTNDAEYLVWIGKNPQGFVLNIRKNNSKTYRKGHTAKCTTITIYKKGQKVGKAFCGDGYRKVVSNSRTDLDEWVKNNGGGSIEWTCNCNLASPVESIGQVLPAGAQQRYFPNEVSAPEKFIEGATQKVHVVRYERDDSARQICIDKWGIECSVCSLNFERRYGERGKGFIHVHHLKPLSEIKKEYVLDAKNDLRPVCPNCHAMIHRSEPVISIDELKAVFRKNQ